MHIEALSPPVNPTQLRLAPEVHGDGVGDEGDHRGELEDHISRNGRITVPSLLLNPTILGSGDDVGGGGGELKGHICLLYPN